MWKATNQGLMCNINQCSKCGCAIALYSCCVPVHCNTSPYNKSSCCNSCVYEANNFYIQDRWLCGHSGTANSRIRASAEPSALLQKLFAKFVCLEACRGRGRGRMQSRVAIGEGNVGRQTLLSSTP